MSLFLFTIKAGIRQIQRAHTPARPDATVARLLEGNRLASMYPSHPSEKKQVVFFLQCETWVPRSKNSFTNRKKSKILRKSYNYYLMVGFIVRPLLELAFLGGWNRWFMIIIIQFKSGSTSSVSVFMSRCRHWSKSSSFITMMTEEHINVDTTPLMKLEI